MILFLDAGHGSIAPNGEYTTKGKQFTHPGLKLHLNTDTFYEGYSNRLYAESLIAKLTEKAPMGYNWCSPSCVFNANDNIGSIDGYENAIVRTYHPYEDWSLQYRVQIANMVAARYPKQKCFFLSLHSNAASGTATGISIWTTKGQTNSDVIADKLWNELDRKKLWHMMSQFGDGDKDYEADFYVIKHTNMPAVLVEYLFFDNREDVMTIVHDDVRKEAYIQALVNVIRFMNPSSQEALI